MKRGYAVSGMLYTILVLFMALLLSFLYTMQNKKNILDKLKTEVVEAFYCSKADNIEDLRGATVIATSVKQEGDNALIQLPKEGRYDTTSYLSVPMSEISSNNGNTLPMIVRYASSTYQAVNSHEKILLIGHVYNESHGANTSVSVTTDGNATINTVKSSGQLSGDGGYSQFKIFEIENLAKRDTLTMDGFYYPCFLGFDISNLNYNYYTVDSSKSFSGSYTYIANKNVKKLYVISYDDNSNTSHGFSYTPSNDNIISNDFFSESKGYSSRRVLTFDGITSGDTIDFSGYYSWQLLIIEIY